MNKYYPEGALIELPENTAAISSLSRLEEAMRQGTVLEARASVCDSNHNLIVDLPCGRAVIPRTEGAVGIEDGTTRDIALITKVNKPVAFRVMSVSAADGSPRITLSRRAVQQECIDRYITSLVPGDIIPARVTVRRICGYRLRHSVTYPHKCHIRVKDRSPLRQIFPGSIHSCGGKGSSRQPYLAYP